MPLRRQLQTVSPKSQKVTLLRLYHATFTFCKRLNMGNVSEKVEAAAAPVTGSSAAPPATEQPKKLKPCCACPETKRARDAW